MTTPKKATAKKVRVDSSFMNAFTPPGMRGRMANYGSEFVAGGTMMDEQILLSTYIHNGFARLVVDKPAEEMTRAGFDIVGLSDDVVKNIKSKFEELDASKKFNEAIKWQRAFGGGIIILGLNDGGKLEDELSEDKIKDIEFMRVYDRYEAIPDNFYDTPEEASYGKVQHWAIHPKSGGSGYKVHSSRVLVFDGESIPNDMRVGNSGWGASIIQNCFVQLYRLDKSYKWSLLMLEKMQQAVHKIPGLSQQIEEPEGEALIQKRVAIADSVRCALNTIVVDSLEDYKIDSHSLAGITDIMKEHKQALSAVSMIPMYFMGDTSGGLNSSDSSKQEGWYAQVESWQNDKLRKQLDRLISFCRLVATAGASDGGEYTIEFKPLFTPSDKDVAETELKKEQTKKTKMETLTGYCNASMIDQDEGREEIREEYGLEGDAPEPIIEKTDPLTKPTK